MPQRPVGTLDAKLVLHGALGLCRQTKAMHNMPKRRVDKNVLYKALGLHTTTHHIKR